MKKFTGEELIGRGKNKNLNSVLPIQNDDYEKEDEHMEESDDQNDDDDVDLTDMSFDNKKRTPSKKIGRSKRNRTRKSGGLNVSQTAPGPDNSAMFNQD